MSNDNEDIDRFFEGGGGKSAKFDNLGDIVKGTVISASQQQQRGLDDGKLLTWDNGEPRMQAVIRLQTDQRDPELDDDDGVRTLYAKGGNYEAISGQGQSMKKAIQDALIQAKAKMRPGGTLKVAYTGEGKKTNRAYAAPKLYTAKYEPSSETVAADLFDD